MALPGYCIGDLVEDAAFLEANERAMQAIAGGRAGHHGSRRIRRRRHVREERHRHESGSTTRPPSFATAGSSSARARSLLPNYRYFDDKRYFTPGDRREPVDMAAGRTRSRLGVSICEDMWDDFYDVKPLAELSDKGASVLLNLNASPFYPGKRHDPRSADPRATSTASAGRSST